MRFPAFIVFSVFAAAAPVFALDKGHDRAATQQIFKQSDANGDRQLNKAEFRKFIDACASANIGRAPMVQRFGAYDTAFSRSDANKDGVVTLKELAALNGT